MYLRSFTVKNIRSIAQAKMRFAAGEEAGWHVILGANGSGKSSMVRAFALMMMGEKEAWASRQDFAGWLKSGTKTGEIEAKIVSDKYYDAVTTILPGTKSKSIKEETSAVNYALHISLNKALSDPAASIDIEFHSEPSNGKFWANHPGQFAASFGPFRRFTGGDNRYDRLFISNKRLAPHLTALGEDVALTDAMSWLTTLFSQGLQDEKNRVDSPSMAICNNVIGFLNQSAFLPHNAQISRATNSSVLVKDGNGVEIPLDQLSDGYRSALSLVIELIRQMFEIYGPNRMLTAIQTVPGTIQAPGVVFIDEVDAHLHPSWQRDIGRWLTRCFPKVQFVVTTHSPIICRAVAREDGSLGGSVWRLPAPGEKDVFRRIEGDMLNQLIFGNVLDAYATELFGSHVLRSAPGEQKLERLAELNVQALHSGLSPEEEEEQRALRKIFPSTAGVME
jgi:hypothetical protein